MADVLIVDDSADTEHHRTDGTRTKDSPSNREDGSDETIMGRSQASGNSAESHKQVSVRIPYTSRMGRVRSPLGRDVLIYRTSGS